VPRWRRSQGAKLSLFYTTFKLLLPIYEQRSRAERAKLATGLMPSSITRDTPLEDLSRFFVEETAEKPN
jgi:hypothetical protein